MNMNTKTILNAAALLLMVAGIFLRADYRPGGHIAIGASALIMLCTLFAFAVKDNKAAGLSDALNSVLTTTLVLLILGALFKIQHWPGATTLTVAAYAMVFLVPVILVFQKSEFRISRQYFFTFSVFLILASSVFIRQNPVAQYVGEGWDKPIHENQIEQQELPEVEE